MWKTLTCNLCFLHFLSVLKCANVSLWYIDNVAKNNNTRFIHVLYPDKTWDFDQSERLQGPIYIIKCNDKHCIVSRHWTLQCLLWYYWWNSARDPMGYSVIHRTLSPYRISKVLANIFDAPAMRIFVETSKILWDSQQCQVCRNLTGTWSIFQDPTRSFREDLHENSVR